uniref:RING-type domain-containing protein n=1 Tax=Lates calcarifer TaxID=8187 RepID=A0A4W6EIR9_LATCA
MASASSLLYEEQLLCSICLGAFTEPVTTPCGHNYCKACITGYWSSTQKTCLVCLASYCQPHLEPHQRVATLKKVCKRHDKMFELFCHTDQMCVCFMCLKDDHVMHETVPFEHVFRERKAQLENETSEMKMMEDAKAKSIREIKCSVEQRKKESEKEIADIDEVFTALVASLQRKQAELTELIQEKQKAAEKQAEDHVTQLENVESISRQADDDPAVRCSGCDSGCLHSQFQTHGVCEGESTELSSRPVLHQ